MIILKSRMQNFDIWRNQSKQLNTGKELGHIKSICPIFMPCCHTTLNDRRIRTNVPINGLIVYPLGTMKKDFIKDREENSMRKLIRKKKRVGEVHSPGELNNYIHVANLRTWIMLIIALLMLVGTIIWGIFGKVEVVDIYGNVKKVSPITFIIN